VSKVEADMDHNTVTVGFDDGVTSVDQIVGALNDAGYVVKERRELP
jgi:copper chaperone CopZ